MHFFIIGFMGSGKTTLGKKLGEFIPLPVVDMDEYLEAQEGMTIREIFERKGEGVFRQLEHDALLELSERKKPHLIICGGGTSCSPQNRERMRKTGKIILMECEKPILMERLTREKSQRPILSDISDENMEVEINRLLASRKECYHEFDYRFEYGKTDLITFAAQLEEHE